MASKPQEGKKKKIVIESSNLLYPYERRTVAQFGPMHD